MGMDVSVAARQKIGARLRRLREVLGYKTQTDFAKAVGLQRHRYVQYETGERLLTIDAAAAIRAKTNCPIDFLYFGDTHGLPASLRDLSQSEAA
jgi:transcriptional regulator with XRE-family HTH domain